MMIRIIIKNTYVDIYDAVVMAQSHRESSPGSLDECRLSARWLPTLRPSHTTWAVSPPVGCYHRDPPSPFYYYSAKANTHFHFRPAEDGGLSRSRHCSKGVQPMPKAVYRSGRSDKYNRQWWDSKIGPFTPQSDSLSTRLVRSAVANLVFPLTTARLLTVFGNHLFYLRYVHALPLQSVMRWRCLF